MNIEPKLSLNPIFTVEDGSNVSAVNGLFEKAQATAVVSEKRAYLDAIYQILRKQPSIEPKQLSRLFEEYAAQTCYAQANWKNQDDEEGFRKSARLMELSFQMQLTAMNLGSFDYDWRAYSSLEDLIASLGIEKNQNGLFFDKIEGLIIDSDVLVQQSGDLRETLAKTLVRLSYSYQNISTSNTSTHHTLHQKLDTWTEKVIGSETQEQKEMFAEYRYNRCAFLARIAKLPIADQLASYQSVQELIRNSLPDTSSKRYSLLAQIFNMQSILTINLIETTPSVEKRNELYAVSQKLAEMAIDLRQSLSTIEPANKNNHYLLANARTVVIKALLSIQPLTQENVSKALGHSEALKIYYPSNPSHPYAPGWVGSIRAVEAAAGKFSIQIKAPLKL